MTVDTSPPVVRWIDMEAGPVSSEEIRTHLADIRDRANIELTSADADRIAAIIRDAIVRHGGDPANRDQLFGALVASWCSLKVALQTPMLPIVANIWYQAEVLRRMLDGEVPVISIAEMLGLEGLLE